jgi:glucan phosphoethanolaminetransferase (alkaline phosphatase superfamily)
MYNFARSFIVAIIYNILFACPVLWLKTLYQIPITLELYVEWMIAFLSCWLLFHLLLLLGRFGKLLIGLFFAIGSIVNYYIFTFGKGLDIGVVIDALSIESELILELVSVGPMLLFVLFFYFGMWLCQKIKARQSVLYSLIFVTLLSLTLATRGFSARNYAMVYTNHQPFGLFYNVYKFYTKYLPERQKVKNKISLVKNYQFNYEQSTKPLVVVFVIGESLRGDLLEINGYAVNNMPLLSKRRDNLISFSAARSSETATRLSLPYMLTRASFPAWEQANSEEGIISIFKSLGFKTSWIGNQGLFGVYETTFASHALEADYVVTNLDVISMLGSVDVYDESLLPYIKNQIIESSNSNHFIVMHMLGSHWSFAQRYPKKFASFLPSCEKGAPSQCSEAEVLNAYHNSITYSDYVLNELLEYLSDKNALVYFSSDHGVSLGEGGVYGQGASGDNVPEVQHNIAMFLWMSDYFAKHNQESFNLVKIKKDRPLSHDNIFHSILDCTGVKSSIIEKNLSVCH